MSNTAGSRSEGFVDQLLLEAGLDDDAALRPALLQLRGMAAAAPEPSAAILALMAPAPTLGENPQGANPATEILTTVNKPEHLTAVIDRPQAHAPQTHTAANPTAASPIAAETGAMNPSSEGPAAPVDELAARRKAKRRIALTTLSVAVSLTAGGAVAAASDQQFRESVNESFSQLNQAVTSFITGSVGTPVSDKEQQPAVPQPAAPAGPASIPTEPATATVPAEVPPSDAPVLPGDQAGQPATPGNQGEVPGPETLPTVVPGDITSGLGEPPRVPLPAPSGLPLPETLPAMPLR